MFPPDAVLEGSPDAVLEGDELLVETLDILLVFGRLCFLHPVEESVDCRPGINLGITIWAE